MTNSKNSIKIKKIIAVVDPMCSWCYGFEPELSQLIEYVKKVNQFEFEMIVGGLRGAGSKVWDEKFKNFLKTNWQKVSEVSSQKFGFELLDKKYFDYNTEPACRAIVSVRCLEPNQVFNAFSDLQKAFYQQSKDITNSEVIADVISQLGIDKKDFLAYFESDEAIEKTKNDYQKAKSMGIYSFPSLIFLDDNQNAKLLNGYHRFESIIEHL